MTNQINCRKCENFYITWDPKKPMGCRAYGFKSKQLPSHVVFSSTGEHCNAFEIKKRLKE